MIWKKANLFEKIRHNIFLDEYGYCHLEWNGIFINDLNCSDLYVLNESENQYIRLRFDGDDIFKNIEKIFNSKIAKRKQTNQPYYGYRSQDYLMLDQAVPIKVKKVTINLTTNYYAAFGPNGGGQRQERASDKIEIECVDDLKKYECWYSENSDISSFVMVILPEIKVGDEFYLVGVGKVRVSKMIDYPNKDNDVCEVVDIEDKKHIINMESEVFYLPYKKVIDEYEPLNNSLEELRLSPYVMCSKEMDVYNVYWNKIEEAVCYHVMVYKYLNIRNRRRILFIADYEVDRNTYYFALDKMVGGEFIFKVKAEDRNGKIVAESRGIVNGSPKFFGK